MPRSTKLVTTDETVGFIRVRKRKLKPDYLGRIRESVSYDLVRAVRINGKPRHKFVLGFGSPVSRYYDSAVPFWGRVFARTAHHGFSKPQQFQIADQLRRKNIPLPTVKECKAAKAEAIEWNESYPDYASPPETFDVLIAFIRRA
jgi:hypothetical protein